MKNDVLLIIGILILIALSTISILIGSDRKNKKPKYEYLIGDTNMNSVTIYGDTLIIHNVYGVSTIGNETYINLDSAVSTYLFANEIYNVENRRTLLF